MLNILSLSNSSVTGMAVLKPLYLNDLIGKSVKEAGQQLLSSLCNFMLFGEVNSKITLYESSLCTLFKKKNNSGICLIAVGCIFYHLVSKLGCRRTEI